MSDAGCYIENLDEFIAALKAFPKEVQRGLKVAMRVASEVVRSGVAEYPAASGANMPPGLNGYSWYQRGFGTKTVTGRAYATSENLGKSWTVRVKSTQRYVRGIIGTNVSYAGWVQGKRQAGIHNMRGWKTVERVLFIRSGRIWRAFGDVVKKALAKITAGGG